MTSKQILDDLDSALKQFGTYTFDDKGASEVMSLTKIARELGKLSSDEAGQILKEVREAKYEFDRNVTLAEEIINCLTFKSPEWFDNVLEISGCEY